MPGAGPLPARVRIFLASGLWCVFHRYRQTPGMEAALSPVDPRSYEAGMLGTDAAGLYRLP